MIVINTLQNNLLTTIICLSVLEEIPSAKSKRPQTWRVITYLNFVGILVGYRMKFLTEIYTYERTIIE